MSERKSKKSGGRRRRGRRRSSERPSPSSPPAAEVPAEAPFKRVMLPEAGEAAVRVGMSCRHLDIESIAVVVPGRDCRFAEDCDLRVELPEADDPATDAKTLVEGALAQEADVILPGYEHLNCFEELLAAAAEKDIRVAATRLVHGEAPLTRQGLLDCLEELSIPAAGSQRVPAERLLEIVDDVGRPLIARSELVGARAACWIASREEAERALELLHDASGHLWLEEPVEQRRSLAVTVIGDAHGDAAALLERDHSAVESGISESPSPALIAASDGEALRGAIFDVVTRLWRHLGVVGVGTVHIGLDVKGGFIVEDVELGLMPEQLLTEWVSSVDLVEWQLRVHAGQPLSEDLHTPPESGHAFSAHVRRAKAPDDEAEAFGEIGWPPTSTSKIRVFSPFVEGMDTPKKSEALLARVTTYGAVRHQALLTMDRVLAGCRFPPVQTNVDALRRIANDEAFRFGQYDADSSF